MSQVGQAVPDTAKSPRTESVRHSLTYGLQQISRPEIT